MGRQSPVATHERVTPVTLVGRRQEPLDLLAKELTSAGATAHVITADLSRTEATPGWPGRFAPRPATWSTFALRPTPDTGFVSAANLTPQHAQNFMPLIFYAMLALVQEFLPHMPEQGDGAILTAQGGSTVHGLPNMSGPGPAQAAQRNYLQSLHAEVAGKGVYVGMLYVGASHQSSAFHTEMEKAKAARATRSGKCLPSTPDISPACSGLCTARRDNGKSSIRSIACRGSVP